MLSFSALLRGFSPWSERAKLGSRGELRDEAARPLTSTLGVMKFLSLRQPPKVQSVWRAVLAGVAALSLSIVVLGIVYWAVRPFVWAAIYSEPYRPPPGPYSPNSGEWLFVQGISFCASFVAGVASAYWSPPRSRVPIVLLVALNLGVFLFGQFPLDTSLFRNALYALNMPAGIVIGAALLWHVQSIGKKI